MTTKNVTMFIEEIPDGEDRKVPSQVYEWQTVKAKRPPPGRGSHSFTQVGNTPSFVLFGGADRTGQFFNDVFCFDIAAGQWTSPKVRNEKPCARTGHSAVFYDNRIVIYGGLGIQKEEDGPDFLSDVWTLETQSFAWQQQACEGQAPRRNGHSALLCGHYMVVIGGSDQVPQSTIHALDLRTWKWHAIENKTQTFAAREMHAAVVHSFDEGSQSSVIVVGGGRGTESMVDTMVRLDVNFAQMTGTVTELSTMAPLCGYSMFSAEGLLHIFGGTTGEGFSNSILYTEEDAVLRVADDKQRLQVEWEEATVQNAKHAPAPRFVHTLAEYVSPAPQDGVRRFVLFGGISPEAEHKDVTILEIHTVSELQTV